MACLRHLRQRQPPVPPGPDALSQILAIALAPLEAQLSRLSDAVNQLTTNDQQLNTELAQVLAILNSLAANTAQAVAAALAAAGADDDTQAAAVEAVNTSLTAQLATVQGALNSTATTAPPAVTPGAGDATSPPESDGSASAPETDTPPVSGGSDPETDTPPAS